MTLCAQTALCFFNHDAVCQSSALFFQPCPCPSKQRPVCTTMTLSAKTASCFFNHDAVRRNSVLLFQPWRGAFEGRNQRHSTKSNDDDREQDHHESPRSVS